MEIRQAHAEAVAAKQAGDMEKAKMQLRRRKQLQKHKEALLDMETLGEAAAEQLHEIGQLDSKALKKKVEEALTSAEVRSTHHHGHPPGFVILVLVLVIILAWMLITALLLF